MALKLLTAEELAALPEAQRGTVAAIQAEAEQAEKRAAENADLIRQNQALTAKTTGLEQRLNAGGAAAKDAAAGQGQAADTVPVSKAEFEAFKQAQADAAKAERAKAVKTRVLGGDNGGLLPGYIELVLADEDEAKVKQSLTDVQAKMRADLEARNLRAPDLGGGNPPKQSDAGAVLGEDAVKVPASDLIRRGLAQKK
jgi:hypothetical protein